MAEIRKEAGRKYWQAIYYDHGERKFRSTKTRNKRTAQAVADRYEREANAPGDPAPDPTSIDEACDAMLEEFRELVKAKKRSAASIHMYEVKTGHLKRIFSDGEGHNAVPWDISRINAETMDGYISKRRKEGAAENTIAKELVAASRTLRLMKRWGKWRGDLDSVLPYRFAPEYVPRERFLADMKELQILIGQLPPDHAARAAFGVATSANLGETFHAQRADVGATATLIRGTKRLSRWRTVPTVTDWQRELLAFALDNAQGRDGKLFLFDVGYDSALERACADAKLPHTTSNDLRRTFCHWMKEAGVPRELVAPAMGHKGTKMVDTVYGKPTPEELERFMLRAIAGTAVAQTPAHSVDDTDDPNRPRGRKSRKTVPRAGIEPARGFPQGILSPDTKVVLTARAYKKNRDYSKPAGTTVAQVIALAKPRG
jgi:integrase